MRAVRLQEHHGRDLKLVSGVVMLALAGAMIVRPELLETVTGALWVFGAAAGTALLGIVADRALRPRLTNRARSRPVLARRATQNLVGSEDAPRVDTTGRRRRD